MNRRSSGLLLSKAIEGFFNFKLAEAVSLGTIAGYRHDLKHFIEHVGDQNVENLTADTAREFLGWLRTDYKPKRFDGSTHPLSPKTLRNYWICLSSFFAWLNREFGYDDVMNKVPSPKTTRAPVEPFSREQLELLLKAAEYSEEAKTTDRRKFRMRRSTAKRDSAIILTLVDTGLRATELCSLRTGDADMKTGRIVVKHGVTGGAKGGKGRTVFLGKTARRAVWSYLVGREDQGDDPELPLFLGKFERPMNNSALLHLIKRLGVRTGIKKCHPHRFRHTFAITYLRSGGDVFTLQSLLGHSDLDMVRHYARVAEIDVATVHKRASPADNWHL